MKQKSWSNEQLTQAVINSRSISQVLKELHLRVAGGNYDQIKKYINELGLSTSHFTGKGWNKHRIFIPNPPAPLELLLVENSHFHSHKLKLRLFSAGIKTPKCEICGWCQRSEDERIPVELDHVNGNHSDNRLENLRVLCPNCHSLQATHRGKNKVKYPY